LDKDSLQPLRVATGTRFLHGWALLRPEQFAEFLGPGSAG
jgi:hypothetical protein